MPSVPPASITLVVALSGSVVGTAILTTLILVLIFTLVLLIRRLTKKSDKGKNSMLHVIVLTFYPFLYMHVIQSSRSI